MGKTIILTEDTAEALKNEMAMTKFKFQMHCKKFLASLLQDPVNAQPDAFFKYNKLDKNKLIKALVNGHVMTQKMKVNDHDADGTPHTAKMDVSYGNIKKDGRLNDRLEAVYDSLYPDEPAKIQEATGCCTVGGSGSFLSGGKGESYEYDVPVSGNVVRRKPKKKESVGGNPYDRKVTVSEAITGEDVNKSAALYVYNEDKDHNWYILCARRSNKKDDEEGGKWNPPMGHLHKGETLKEGALRECLEESGIDFSKYKSEIKQKDHHAWGSNFTLALGDYVSPSVTIDNFEPKKGDEENSKFIWLPLQDIDKKTWAWTCGENAKKFIPGEVDMDDSLSESIVSRIVSNIIREATADGAGGLPGEFTTPSFIDKETADRTPGDTCGMHDRVGNSNLEEGRKKVVKNDKGEIVPETCSCGGHIGLYICGEPVYKCAKCGKYYGTMPFTPDKKKKVKKNTNESINEFGKQDNLHQYIQYIIQSGKDGKLSPSNVDIRKEYYNSEPQVDTGEVEDCVRDSYFEDIEGSNPEYSDFDFYADGDALLETPEFNNWIKDYFYDRIIGEIKLNEDGLIKIERNLVIPRFNEHDVNCDKYTKDYEGSIGAYWTYSSERGAAYWNTYTFGNELVLYGLCCPEDVSWDGTIEKFVTYNENEYELIFNGPVELYCIKDKQSGHVIWQGHKIFY